MRLARQVLALQGEMLSGHELQESLVIDGFISYVKNKFYPTSLNLIVGSESCYLYGFTVTQLRRGGRKSDLQQHKAEQIRQLHPIPTFLGDGSFAFLGMQIDQLASTAKGMVTVFSDEHTSYPPMLAGMHHPVVHRTINSQEPRTGNNPLFPVNYFDREIRKDMSEHVRRTCCWARSLQAKLERLVIYEFRHNHHKPFRINAPVDQQHITHGDVAGVSNNLGVRVGSKRFRERIPLSHCRHHLSWFSQMVYLGLVPTLGTVSKTSVPKFVLES